MLRLVIAALLFLSLNAIASEPKQWQMLLQEPASPVMEELYHFHNFLLIVISLIVLFVFALLAFVCIRFRRKVNPVPAKFSHNIPLEIAWTIIPLIILVIIAVPSFRILRLAEKSPDAEITIKVVGYQWYWHYIYAGPQIIEFDSNMIADKNLKPGQKRLLEVDNRIVLPENTVVKFLVTAADVIHSFAVPALGIKIDGVPGRVNETWTKITRKGVYYGQCSELCGINHGFMPIAIEVVSKEEYDKWQAEARLKFSRAPKPIEQEKLAVR